MRAALEQILRNLCATDTEIIKQATADLNEAYRNENTVMLLCDITVTCPEPQIRQYAAVLLSKRLSKLRSWLLINPEQQQAIKVGMLSAVVQEREKSVRNAIVRFLGILMRHNNNDSSWIADLLQFVYSRCSSADANEAELGSSIFAKLADTAPDQFVPHMESVTNMLAQALQSTERTNTMATPVIANIIVGMNYLMPFVVGHTVAEHTLIKSMPLILKAMHAFAYSTMTDQFMNTFDIFHNFAEYAPKFLNSCFRQVVEFCLEIANNKQLENTVRTQGIIYIGSLMRIKKKLIVKQKLVHPILVVLFELMADESSNDSDNDDDFDYFSDDSGSCLVTSASQTLDLIALNIAPDKLIPPLLLLLEPALQSPDQYKRRAGFLCMAVIAEGCSEALCSKYLETMLNIIKVGIADQSPVVRNAAFFALGQFAEHLQPEISKYAHQILPVLFDFLQQLCEEAKNQTGEPKHISRMFYALETFCENLEDEIVPHLPVLMERLLEAMNANNSAELRELALCSMTAAIIAAKEHIIPYFQKLVSILQVYLVNNIDDKAMSLRTQAIDTLAALVRSVGKEHFLPLAEETMVYCLQLLEGAHEPDIRRAVYNLIGSLASIVNEGMATVFPKIMDRIMDSVKTMEEVTPEFRADSPIVTSKLFGLPSSNDDDDIDIENTDEEEDDDGILGYNVNNEYLNEKEEAILCLKECCEKCGAAFNPYMQKAFENVYKMVDHPQECIRITSVNTLCTFILTLQKQKDENAVRGAMKILLPKLMKLCREDDDLTVVTHTFDTLSDIMTETHEAAVPMEDLYDIVFSVISDALNRKLVCQFDDDTVGIGDEDEDNDGESEAHELLIQAAGNLLSPFGSTMDTQRFAMYFGRVHPFFLKKLKTCKKHEDQGEIRSFVYGVIAECFGPLGTYSSTYFDMFLPILIAGLSDTDPKARQNACYGVGELVFFSEQKSYASYPVILQALSELIGKETAPAALDNVCGAVGRLILTNYRLVPLQNVLPVFLRNLPMREDFSENETAIRVFKILFVQAKEDFQNYVEEVLNITLQVLIKKEYEDGEIVPEAVELVKNIRDAYYDKFQSVANASTEINNFVQNILMWYR